MRKRTKAVMGEGNAPRIVKGGKGENTVKFIVRFLTDQGNTFVFDVRFFADSMVDVDKTKQLFFQKRIWDNGSVNGKGFNSLAQMLTRMGELAGNETLLSGTVQVAANGMHGIEESKPKPFGNALLMQEELLDVGCTAKIKWLPSNTAAYLDHKLMHTNAAAVEKMAKQADRDSSRNVN